MKLMTLKQLYDYSKKLFWYILGISFFMNILSIFVIFYTILVYNKILISYSVETLIYLTFITIAVLAATHLLGFVRMMLFKYYAKNFEQQVLPTAVEVSLSAQVHAKQEKAVQLQQDVALIKNFIMSQSVGVFFDLPWFFIYIFVIFLLSYILGLIGLIGAIFICVLVFGNEYLTYSKAGESYKKSSENNRKINTAIEAAEVVVPLGVLKPILESWLSASKKIWGEDENNQKSAAILSSFVKFFRMTLNILMIGVGAYLVITGELGAGSMIGASLLISKALAPVEQTIGIAKQTMQFFQSAQRLSFSLSQFGSRHNGSANIIQTISHETLSSYSTINIKLVNVNLLMPGKKNLLISNMSFDVAPGDFVNVTGENGSGVSTLLKILALALTPSAGMVAINGCDASALNMEIFSKFLGYLPQYPQLLPGTIKQNLSRFCPEKQEELKDLIETLGLMDLISRQPLGLETEIKLSGAPLSASQRKWIALGRALFEKPKLIVLDDPFSSLDDSSVIKLQGILADLKEKGVTIFVGGKYKYVDGLASKIIYLHHGKLGAFGPADKIVPKLNEAKISF